MNDRIDELVGQLTLEEKVALVAGSDTWHTPGVERLGIPPLKVSDGPVGARGEHFGAGPRSACFPCGTALAATWDTDLVERIGQALGDEARSKGAQVLLAPTVNIHRSPLAGRNFERYSEDPHLAARIAVAYISGVQSRGVGTAVKHFVCNDSEFERMTISSEVGERALREIYLVPFEAAVREAGTWSVMAAYNRLNGTYCSEHPRLLTDLLRHEWGWDGVVMSDWFGTRSTAPAANAGLDLEMPGPPAHMGERLLEAVRKGEVDEKTLDEKVRRLLWIRERTGLFEDPGPHPEQERDVPEHRALARQAAAEAIVLLKNSPAAGDGPPVLPLDLGAIRSIALIGPNAEQGRVLGGGSAAVRPHYVVSPLGAIRERVGDAVQVLHEPGCVIDRGIPVLDGRLVAADGRPGVVLECFEGTDLDGEPVLTDVVDRAHLLWLGGDSPGSLSGKPFSTRLHGTFTARETGVHTFSLTSVGTCRLFLDGAELVDNWTEQKPGEAFFGAGTAPVTADVVLAAGEPHELVVEYSTQHHRRLRALSVGCRQPVPDDLVDRAVRSASEADVAVVVVGMTDEWESEGHDRTTMALPGDQAALVGAVAAANPRTVVVINAGSPVTMDWVDRVPAALDVWYPGQECGNAVADVLFGDVNPCGKLPTTFPRRIEDTPAFVNYPGENGAVTYGEGIFVGYRYYDAKLVEPRFPFGHGLSYTTFDYGEVRLSAVEIEAGEEVSVEVDVTNSGPVAGKEVVQVYLADVESSLARPPKELVAFTKIGLAPGETTTVRLTLGRPALSFWDPARASWVAEPGTFEVLVGSSSRDIRSRASFVLAGSPS